jgi:hypothetical protein
VAAPRYAHLTGGENMRLVQRLLGLTDAQVDRAVRTVRLRATSTGWSGTTRWA